MKYLSILCILITFSMSQGKALAIVIKAKGKATVTRNGEDKKVRRGTRLYSEDLIKTNKKSYVAMRFLDDKTLVRVRQNSIMKLQGERVGNTIAKNMFLEAGNIFASVTKQKVKFRVTTPTSVASVKGTKFVMGYNSSTGQAETLTYEGLVEVTIKGKKVELPANTKLVAQKDGTFTKEKFDPSVTEAFETYFDAKKGDEIEIEYKDSDGNIKTLKVNIKE